MKFRRKGKLSLRSSGPYEIQHRVGEVSDELEFPAKLASLHPVFYVSMLKKCLGAVSYTHLEPTRPY